MPIDLYEKKKVQVELERSLDLANLDDLQIIRALFVVPSVRTACDVQGVTQIDRSVLMGRETDITLKGDMRCAYRRSPMSCFPPTTPTSNS
jgi:hypothetical protein